MALSSGLHEALREFVATSQGSEHASALSDLAILDEEAGRDLAQYEDAAFGILKRLYESQEVHNSQAPATMGDEGKGTDELGVDKT
jgi:hypothetical protein